MYNLILPILACCTIVRRFDRASIARVCGISCASARRRIRAFAIQPQQIRMRKKRIARAIQQFVELRTSFLGKTHDLTINE